MKEEIWKPIEGYENYEVSNIGRVRSLNYHRTGKEKILIPVLFKYYLGVNLYKNGKMKCCKIHRLVAQAFIHNPDNLPCINHKNENKTDNRVENLEWCTVGYNLIYSNIHIKGANASKKKLSKPVIQFTLDGKFVAEYPSTMEAYRQTGIHYSNIANCCRGKEHCKSAGNYKWKFKDE